MTRVSSPSGHVNVPVESFHLKETRKPMNNSVRPAQYECLFLSLPFFSLATIREVAPTLGHEMSESTYASMV